MDDYEVPWTMTAQHYRKDGYADPAKFWSGKFTGIVFHYPQMARMACAKAGMEMAIRNVVYDWQKFQNDSWHINNMAHDLFSNPDVQSAEHRLADCEGGYVIFRIKKD